MPKPTATTIIAASKVDFTALDYANDAALEPVVDEALGMFSYYTGRDWSTPSGVWEVGEVPEALAVAAVRKLTEILAFQAQEDRAEAFQDFDLIQSFSAGSYNETRRSADDFRKLQPMLLWSLLGAYMTPEKRDWFMEVNGEALGIDATKIPAFEVSEVDWGANPNGHSYANPAFWADQEADPLYGTGA